MIVLFHWLLDFSQTYQFADRQFAGRTICGRANSQTRCFADTPIRGLWTISGKMFHGQAGLFADKLFEVTALPVVGLLRFSGMLTRPSWPRPRQDPRRSASRPRRDRDIGKFLRDETETETRPSSRDETETRPLTVRDLMRDVF